MQRRIRFCEKYYNDISKIYFYKNFKISKLNEIDRIDIRMVVSFFVKYILDTKMKLSFNFKMTVE